MADFANVAAAISGGYQEITLDRGAGWTPATRWEVRLEQERLAELLLGGFGESPRRKRGRVSRSLFRSALAWIHVSVKNRSGEESYIPAVLADHGERGESFGELSGSGQEDGPLGGNGLYVAARRTLWTDASLIDSPTKAINVWIGICH